MNRILNAVAAVALVASFAWFPPGVSGERDVPREGTATLRPENAALVSALPPSRELTEEEVQAPALVDQSGYEETELRRRVERVIPASAVGMAWVSADSIRVFLQVVGGEATRQAAQQAADGYLKGRISIIAGSFSQDQLAVMVDKGLESVTQQGLIGVRVGLALRMNDRSADASPTVRVSVPSSRIRDSLLDSLTEVVPREALEVVASEPTALLVDRDLNPPYYAGNKGKVVTPSTGTTRRCSTGFVLVNGFGYFGTLAGHCAYRGRTGDNVYLKDTKVDYVRINHFEQDLLTDADVLAYSLSARPTRASASVYVTSSAIKGVTSRYNGSRSVGSAYCAVGDGQDSGGSSKTSQMCSEISETNTAVYADDGTGTRSTIRHLDCSEHQGYRGWSGGPVYLTLANGTIKAAGTTSAGGLSHHCWSLINYLVFLTGAEVDTV